MPAATNALRATAERTLIKTVPCHGPLRPFICRSIGIQRRFPDVFADAENGFVPPEFCVAAARGRNIASLHRRLGTQPGVQGLWQ